MELSKDTYERAGLQGSPISSGGRKHIVSRYGTAILLKQFVNFHKTSQRDVNGDIEVKMNLRLPSMLHGKKGFERLVWASKNVLNQNLVWVFSDLNLANGIAIMCVRNM